MTDSLENSTERQPEGQMPESFDVNFVIARAREIVLNPKTIWPKLRAEKASIRGLYLSYIAVLAAVPIVCEFLRMVTIGRSLPFVGVFRWSFFGGLAYALMQYVLLLAVIYLSAFLVEKIAPRFGGSADRLSVIKLLAYSATPTWAAGVCRLVPFAWPIELAAAVFGIYLLVQAIPVMTGDGLSKRWKYLASIIGCSIIAGIVMGLLTMPFAPDMPKPKFENGEQLELPGGVSVDVNKFNKTMEQLQKLAPAQGK